MHEKRELLAMLREMWQMGNSPLHRIYSSWEELEQHVDVQAEKKAGQEKHVLHPCPHCGEKQIVAASVAGFFPYQECTSCKQAFYVNKDLTIRKAAMDERENVAAPWVQIVEDLKKKKMAIVFKLE